MPNPVTSTPPVSSMIVAHDATHVTFRALMQGGNGTGGRGESVPSKTLEIGNKSTPQ